MRCSPFLPFILLRTVIGLDMLPKSEPGTAVVQGASLLKAEHSLRNQRSFFWAANGETLPPGVFQIFLGCIL
jgi:hypothetical protein